MVDNLAAELTDILPETESTGRESPSTIEVTNIPSYPTRERERPATQTFLLGGGDVVASDVCKQICSVVILLYFVVLVALSYCFRLYSVTNICCIHYASILYNGLYCSIAEVDVVLGVGVELAVLNGVDAVVLV